MLDITLRHVSTPFLREITLTFAKSTHTAIVGPPASGASTLLRLIAGQLRPTSGEIHIGARDVTRLSASRRPILYVTSHIDVPERWSVRHLLVAAVRQRSLDREDRHHEYELAVEKWKLSDIVDRPLRLISASERAVAHLARIELLRPAIVVADRLLEELNASALSRVADDFYRTLRVIGTTVISAPASLAELGLADRVVVLERGEVVQDGVSSHVYRSPAEEAAAIATGEINVIPVSIHGIVVDSPIGSWEANASFQGSGVALARPESFTVAAPGEESDLIFSVEEASFRLGRWSATGILSGGLTLRVELPGEIPLQKGRLLPLRFDASRFTLLKRD